MRRRSVDGRHLVSVAIAILACGIALHAHTELLPGTAEQTPTPKLIWEKEFGSWIKAVGVDEECLARMGGDIDSCLKWVLSGSGFRLVDGSRTRSVKAHVDDKSISSNGRFVCVCKRKRRLWRYDAFVHSMLDWNGRLLWQTDDEIHHFAVARNDGSAVFLLADVRGVCGVRLYDRRGKLRAKCIFPRVQELVPFGVSDSMFALLTPDRGGGYDLHVYDTKGRVVWSQTGIQGGNASCREVAVSDRGEVLMCFDHGSDPGCRILAYDARGVLSDSIEFPDATRCCDAKSDGRLAFVTAGPRRAENGRLVGGFFLCYDLAEMRSRFIRLPEDGHYFGYISVDADAHIVVVEDRFGREFGSIQLTLLIYDLNGAVRAAVPVEFGVPYTIRALGEMLLLAKRNKLQLYEVDLN